MKLENQKWPAQCVSLRRDRLLTINFGFDQTETLQKTTLAPLGNLKEKPKDPLPALPKPTIAGSTLPPLKSQSMTRSPPTPLDRQSSSVKDLFDESPLIDNIIEARVETDEQLLETFTRLKSEPAEPKFHVRKFEEDSYDYDQDFSEDISLMPGDEEEDVKEEEKSESEILTTDRSVSPGFKDSILGHDVIETVQLL